MGHQPGDEIEWWDGEADPPRWVPGKVLAVSYHVYAGPGDDITLPEPMVRSAPRLPLDLPSEG
jgi:hypothetical protein